MARWRVIVDGPKSASFNMAADAFLFEQAETHSPDPVLRLYAWDRPSITIGHHQRLERAVDRQKLGETPVVRRITGGRALLHDDGEITYAIAGDFRRHPYLGDTLTASYRLIAEAIIRFYQALGRPADMACRDDPVLLSGGGGFQKGCFASVSRFEITAGGRKLAASSQRRGVRALMQHGVIRIVPPSIHPAIVHPAVDAPEASFPFPAGSRQDWERLLIRAFEETFRMTAVRLPFSAEELTAVHAGMDGYKNLAVRQDLIKQPVDVNSLNCGDTGGSKGQKTS